MITRKELYTINSVPGKKVVEVLGYVKGSTVQTKNIGKDIKNSRWENRCRRCEDRGQCTYRMK